MNTPPAVVCCVTTRDGTYTFTTNCGTQDVNYPTSSARDAAWYTSSSGTSFQTAPDELPALGTPPSVATSYQVRSVTYTTTEADCGLFRIRAFVAGPQLGCTIASSNAASRTVQCVIAALPEGGATEVCADENIPAINVTLTGGGATYEFAYKINGGADILVTNASSINVPRSAIATPGRYEITISSVTSAGCSGIGKGTYVINVLDSENPSLASLPDPICRGVDYDLASYVSPSRAGRFEGEFVTGSTLLVPIGSTATTTTVTFKPDASRCVSDASITVGVQESQPVTLSLPPQLCSPLGSYDLRSAEPTNAAGGTWSGPGVDPATSTLSFSSPGIIQLSYAPNASDAQRECLSAGSGSIEILPYVEAQLERGRSFCAGQTLDLNGLLQGEPIAGEWRLVDNTQGTIDPAGVYDPGVFVGSAEVVFEPTASCRGESVTSVEVTANTVLALNADFSVCAGAVDRAQLLADPSTTVSGTFSVNGSPVSFPYPVATGTTTTFTFTPSDVCSQTSQVSVSAVAPVRRDLVADFSRCVGDAIDRADLFQGSGPTDGTFTLNGTAVAFPYTVTAGAPVTLTYTPNAACRQQTSVTISALPTAQVTLTPPPASVCVGEELRLDEFVPDGVTGVWTLAGQELGATFVAPQDVEGRVFNLRFTPDPGTCLQPATLRIPLRLPAKPELLPADVCELEVGFDLAGLVVDPAFRGGTWSGVPATAIAGQILDASVLGQGEFSLAYLAPGACVVAVQTPLMVRAAAATPVVRQTEICNSELPFDLTTLELDGARGGTWSGPGVTNAVYDAGATVAEANLRYGFTDSVARCARSAAVRLVVREALELDIDGVVLCAGTISFDLTALEPRDYPGGTWASSSLTVSDNVAELGTAAPGTFDITYTAPGECAPFGKTTLELLASPEPVIGAASVCASLLPFDLRTLVKPGFEGGTWQGAGVTGDQFNGVEGQANNVLPYSFIDAADCRSLSISAIMVVAAIGLDLASGSICANEVLQLDELLPAGAPGGSWFDATGSLLTFFSSSATGVYEFTYLPDDPSQCFLATTTAVTVGTGGSEPFRPIVLCSSDEVFSLADVPGGGNGTWTDASGAVVTQFDPGSATTGRFTYVSTGGDCQRTGELTITVAPPEPATLLNGRQLCQSGKPLDLDLLLADLTVPGRWSSAGIELDELDPAGFATGFTRVLFTRAEGCQDTSSVAIEILATPRVELASGTVCSGPGTYDLSRLIVAGDRTGSWSGQGLLIEDELLSLVGLTAGDYDLQYLAPTRCAVPESTTLKVVPATSITFEKVEACSGGPNLALASLFPGTAVPGSWSSGGLVITVDSVLLKGAEPSSYTLTFTPEGECTQASTVEIDLRDGSTSIVAERSFCIETASVTLPTLGGGGGIWSGPNVLGNTFSPSGYGTEGVDTLDYVIGRECPRTYRLPINVQGAITIPVATNTFCNRSDEIELRTYDPTVAPGGTWTQAGVAIDRLDLGTITLGDSVRLVYTPPNASCGARTVDQYFKRPVVQSFGLDLKEVCVADGPVLLGGFADPSSAVGTWSGVGVAANGFYRPGRPGETTAVTFSPTKGCFGESSYTFDLVDVGQLGHELPTFECSDNTYTASVVINPNGNNGTITPSLGTLVNTVLTVTGLISGTPASVTLSADGACATDDLSIDLSYTCPSTACEADAGTLAKDLYSVCEGEDFEFEATNDFKLGLGDVFFYVLDDDDDPANGTLAISATSNFAYDAAYLGADLVVYSLAGTSDNAGFIDLSDKCLSRSPSAVVEWFNSVTKTEILDQACAPGDVGFFIVVRLPGFAQNYTDITSEVPFRTVIDDRTLAFGPYTGAGLASFSIEDINGCEEFRYSVGYNCGNVGPCLPPTAGTFSPGPFLLCGPEEPSIIGFRGDVTIGPDQDQRFVVYADAALTDSIGFFDFLPTAFSAYADRGVVYVTSRVGRVDADGDLEPACTVESAAQEVRFGESLVTSRREVVCGQEPVVRFGRRFDPTLPTQQVRAPGPAGTCDTTLTLTIDFVAGKDVTVTDSVVCGVGPISRYGRTFDVDNTSAVFEIGNGLCVDRYNLSYVFTPPVSGSAVFELCAGQTVFVGNTEFSEANPSGEVLLRSRITGCDSIVSVSVTFPEAPTIEYELVDPACNPTEIAINFEVAGGRALTGVLQNGVEPSQQITIVPGVSTLTFPIAGDPDIRIADIRAALGGCAEASPSILTIAPEVSRLQSVINVPLSGSYVACENSPVPSITVDLQAGVGPFSYAWDRGDTTRVIRNVEVGAYEVTVTDALGCTSTSTVDVARADTIEYAITTVDPVCPEDFGTATVDILTNEPGLRYRFDLPGFEDATSDVIFRDSLTSGTYVLQFVQANGCRQNTFIDIVDPALVDPIAPDTLTVNLGQRLALSVDGPGVDSVQWTPASFVDCDTCASVFVGPVASGNLAVVVIDELGCSIGDSVYIEVLPGVNVFIPNAFSPNGDGVNDVLLPEVGPEVARIVSFRVYSRWGGAIHEFFNIQPGDRSAGWDGSYRGKALDTGVYVCTVTVELINGETSVISGDVGLFR